MEKIRTEITRLLRLASVFSVVWGFSLVSCIGSTDDDEQPKPPVVVTPESDSTLVLIDSSFTATAEFVLGEWMGQYVGFDARQRTVSAIRRLVYFAPDGSYDSHVQGLANMTDTTVTEYREFEHEHGTYAFDVHSQQMTYRVEYDSLLDFRNDRLVLNPAKVTWSERMWFSAQEEGRRDWIRTDENLTVPDDQAARVVYRMRRE